MLLGGDEFRRSQGGNNNAYCQDNEMSWHDWGLLKNHEEIFRFTQGMIAFRRAHPVLSEEKFYASTEIHWVGPYGRMLNWADPKEKQLACLIHEGEQGALFLMFNAGCYAVEFNLPTLSPSKQWYVAADTSREAPRDLSGAGEESLCQEKTYHLGSRTCAILLAQDSNVRAGGGH